MYILIYIICIYLYIYVHANYINIMHMYIQLFMCIRKYIHKYYIFM